MLKSSALLLRCGGKKDLIGSFLCNSILSWWSNTIYEVHPNSSQHFESHSSQPISDTWHVTLFLPRCSPSLSPPTSSFPASNEQRWTTQRTSGVRAPGPLNQPPAPCWPCFSALLQGEWHDPPLSCEVVPRPWVLSSNHREVRSIDRF